MIPDTKDSSARPDAVNSLPKETYSRLYFRFVLLTLLCSVVPLILVGWGIYTYYSRFGYSRMVEDLLSKVESHRKIVELFLKERVSTLQLLSQSHSLEHLSLRENLERIFEISCREGSYFTDLGVLNDKGRHLAYVGPYDLMANDYSGTFWFKEVMEKGVYISDMFLGFRKVPHFIIVVARTEGDRKWLLRATIYNEFLSALFGNVRIGRTGDVFLLNSEGVYQTTPRSGGLLMGQAPLPMHLFREESGVEVLTGTALGEEDSSPRLVVAYSWMKDPKWVLVVRQDYAEAFREVNHANIASLVFLALSALAILVVSLITTRHMIKVIRKRDEEADQLNKQLYQACKLASVGELASGVAHEINNPLAIILTEAQVIRDVEEDTANLDIEFKSQLDESLDQIETQVQRCNLITRNLLRFSRRTRSLIERVDLNRFLQEVIDLMHKKAQTSGIQLSGNFEENLPPLQSDPSQLQQVFLNLINNAIEAHDGKPYGTVRITTRTHPEREGAEIIVADTGAGITRENIEKIFDPFFTTKPVGKGTGLGLSISYGIVQRLGGNISVRSEVGKGTEFILFLPFRLPRDVEDGLENAGTGGSNA
ncbi:MAG: two-component sensor histidine kinase [Syntrophobacteraceae bacterium]|nr:two-component sensor histidine kinase [Syntrophobacteraceae bacterium]